MITMTIADEKRANNTDVGTEQKDGLYIISSLFIYGRANR